MGKCLIIGAYGGEHVGDAAILGGVILRIRKKFGVTEFDVLTSRRDRTEFWVSNLNIEDVSVDVICNQDLKGNIYQYSMCVYGGGPLMDLPVRLSSFLSIIKRIKSNGGVFYIEGCGFGPFKRRFSKHLASKIIKESKHIVARTEASYQAFKGLHESVELDFDPAFDYLEYLNDTNSSYETDVFPNKKNLRIGINIRPMWSKYIDADIKEDDIDSIVIGLFNKVILSNPDVNFDLIPLNSDQFGFSDLNPLSQLSFDFLNSDNVFLHSFEFKIEDLVKVLAEIDIFISMRFHGCIFGLKYCPKVVGIDYAVGKEGKVTELFQNRSEDHSLLKLQEIISDVDLAASKINSEIKAFEKSK